MPGAVANILTGGAATKTNAGTYAVTADFVPTDTTNYNTLTGLSAGNFIIQKATPTATLAVTNSPQTYTGSPQAATVGITVSSVPGAVANILTGGAATKTNAGTYAVTADFVPTDTTNYNTLTGLVGRELRHPEGDSNGDAGSDQLAETYDGSPPGGDGRHHGQFRAGRGGEHSHRWGCYQDQRGDLCGDGGLRAHRHDQLQYTDWAIGWELRHQQGERHVYGHAVHLSQHDLHRSYAHGDVSTITGVNGETGATVGTVNVTDTMHTNVGIYNSDPWTFTGTANYNNTSGTVDDCIAKANATVVVTPYTCPTTTYTGLPHTATYTITGVNGETGATVGTVNVSGTTHTNAGTYNNDPWSFTGSGQLQRHQRHTVNDCIAKADATVVVTPYTCPSDDLYRPSAHGDLHDHRCERRDWSHGRHG